MNQNEKNFIGSSILLAMLEGKIPRSLAGLEMEKTSVEKKKLAVFRNGTCQTCGNSISECECV
jgi:hypothetical protein